MISRIAAVAVVAALAAPVRAADPTDVADLFPAGTLAFVELHKPADFAPQFAALLKGTPLEDGVAFVHARRDKAKSVQDVQGKQDLALAALFGSPELFAELKKVRGAAVGLTGFTDLGEPEIALAVLTGDTPALGLAARAFLTMDTSLRRVASVGDVPVYQQRNPNIVHDPMTGQPRLSNDKPPVEGPHEPTFAYAPGLFVIASSKKAVADVVTRFRGAAKDALSASPGFKEASAGHRRAGLFFYFDAPPFISKFETAAKQKGDLPGTDLVAWVKMLAGAKALRAVAGCAAFRDNGLSLTATAAFAGGQKSPLHDFLSVPGVKVELLHHAPRPAVYAAAVTLPAANRTPAVLAFLDALAKAGGELGRLPGEAVRELEGKYKTPIAAEMIDKTKAVTIVMPAKQELPKGTLPLPMLVLHCDTAAAAEAWEGFLPKLVADVGNTPPAGPSSEAIGGVKVFSLPGTGLPWKGPVHYARKDATVAVGLDRKLVAQALLGEAGGSVAGGDKPLTAPTDAVVLLGGVALGEVLRGLSESRSPDGPVVPVPTPQVGPGGQPQPEPKPEDLAKARREFFDSFGALPPAAITARRTGKELRFELFQPKVQGGGLASVIAAGVGWYDRSHDANSQGGNMPFGGGRIRRGDIQMNWGKPGEP